jgi:hypothetical protein
MVEFQKPVIFRATGYQGYWSLCPQFAPATNFSVSLYTKSSLIVIDRNVKVQN